MRRMITALLGIAFAVCTANAHAADKVYFAVPGLIMPDLPIHYAVDEGFLKKEGLDAEILQTDRRDLATVAVLSGDAIASVTDPAEASLAFARGADLKAIAGLAVNAPPFLVGDDSVTSDPKTWKGKTIALFTPPNTLYTLMMRELKKGGWKEVEKNVYRLDPNDKPESYLKVSLGKRGTELSALLADRANITVIHEPDASTAVIRGGKKKLHAFSKDFEQMLWTSLNTSGEAIKTKPEVIQKVINGINAALEEIHANPDKAASFATKIYSKADPKVVQAAVKDLIAAGVFPENCMMKSVGWDSNVGLLKLTNPDSKAVSVKFEDIADLSFCKKAIGVGN